MGLDLVSNLEMIPGEQSRTQYASRSPISWWISQKPRNASIVNSIVKVQLIVLLLIRHECG